MEEQSPAMIALFEAAKEYEQRQDYYNAVKLYKRVAREAVTWAAPLLRLGAIYKQRQEWKPALYYNKKAIALAVDNQEAWWNVGIAATALNKRRLAKSIWAKFGQPGRMNQLVSVKLTYTKQFEILGARQMDPARAQILNIPHPDSGRRYRDVVLIDNTIIGYHSSGFQRLPIYNELGIYKASTFSTFSCILHQADDKSISSLRQLCTNAGLGFELWSNASRAYTVKSSEYIPEYHTFPVAGESELLVGLAAKREYQVLDVLESWKVISLKNYSDFQSY
jgi:hypothetical protein